MSQIHPSPDMLVANKAVESLAGANFKSPLRYPGGKQKAISQISKMFPPRALEYREPMVGGGSVYFRARSIQFAEKYWINDMFQELIGFWQSVQDEVRCERLRHDLEVFRKSFKSAEEIKSYFQKARLEEPADQHRSAFLFFFFNRVTFSGTTRAGGFSKSASMSRFTASSIQRLVALPEALKSTKITNLDYMEVIATPGRDVFLFLDPPYFTANRLYGKNGSLHNFDHERLSFELKRTTHKFLLTYDDCSEIRQLYKWASIHNWQLQYGMNNCNADKLSKVGSELFICNYRTPI